MSQHKIEVGMGEGAITGTPYIISSTGIGSCVVVILYDSTKQVGGLAHIMLPDSVRVIGRRPPYHCADTAIASLLNNLQTRGAVRENLVAKMVGGAQMFASSNGSGRGIGMQNIANIRLILDREKLPLVGEDTDGAYGRGVEFHLNSGRVIVSAVGRKDREL